MSILIEIVDRSTYPDATKTAYRLCVGRFVAFAGADPAVWSPLVVESWRDTLRKHVGDRTVNKHLYALRYAAKRYEALGYGPDFARGAETLHIPGKKHRRALSVDQVGALLATCDYSPHGIRDRAAIVMAVRTGMRAAEIVGLNWGSLNGALVDFRAKGNQHRQFSLDAETLRALEPWAQWLQSQGLKLHGRVFRGISQPRVNGSYRIWRQLSRQALHQAISERGRSAGISRPIHTHLFRHTFVTWALQNGVPAHRVMLYTGHKSLETLSKYADDLEAQTDPVSAYLPTLETDD